jgi:hypothetical protein
MSEEVAAAVLAAFSSGRLRVVPPAIGLDGQDPDVNRTEST